MPVLVTATLSNARTGKLLKTLKSANARAAHPPSAPAATRFGNPPQRPTHV